MINIDVKNRNRNLTRLVDMFDYFSIIGRIFIYKGRMFTNEGTCFINMMTMLSIRAGF